MRGNKNYKMKASQKMRRFIYLKKVIDKQV